MKKRCPYCRDDRGEQTYFPRRADVIEIALFIAAGLLCWICTALAVWRWLP